MSSSVSNSVSSSVSSSSVSAPVTMQLPFSPSSVSVARQRLRAWLDRLGTPSEAVDDARVVISELVANSVRHARPLGNGQILVSWTLEPDGLRLSVTDGGSHTRPRALCPSASSLAGRGMAIVEVLSRKWWSDQSPSRTTVHALLRV